MLQATALGINQLLQALREPLAKTFNNQMLVDVVFCFFCCSGIRIVTTRSEVNLASGYYCHCRTVAEANRDAVESNRHVTRALKIDDTVLFCTRCHETIAPIGSSMNQFTQELCLASRALTDVQRKAIKTSRVLRYAAAASRR